MLPSRDAMKNRTVTTPVRAFRLSAKALAVPTSFDGSSNLQSLGRRMERLFFTGFLLTALCFVEMYVTAANEQFAQDRSLTTISALTKRIYGDQVHLQQLFQTKKDVQPQGTVAPVPQPTRATTERDRLIAQSRRRLGLSPTPTPKVTYVPPPITTAPVETYESVLRIRPDAQVRLRYRYANNSSVHR
jgi:hypothetical protein